MKIAGKNLSQFTIRPQNGSTKIAYAASQLQQYVVRATGEFLGMTMKEEPHQIVLQTGYEGKPDGFKISVENGNLYLTGESERGVIYAVWSFLEKCIGWRFFAAKMRFHGQEAGSYMKPVETVLAPEINELNDGEGYEENPVVVFRDVFGHASVDEEWCVKNRINGDIWGLKNVPDYMGGSESLASMGGHSFSELVPASIYFEDHPEYFSFVNGKWHGGADYQICLTNPEVVEVAVERAKNILRKKPHARYVSVSQNDNNNFCQCENCKKAEEKMGRGSLLFSFVNKVAEKIEEEFPKVKIHTYSYESGLQNDPIPLRDNVMVQFCLQYCRGHELEDANCKVNSVMSKLLKNMSKKCKEMFIYDYISSEAYIFQHIPDFYRMRKNMRFLADCNVTGIYAEGDIFCLNSPCMEELRAYLFAKLTWNPYMSEEEFTRHINEFLQAYYGAGWKHIKAYMDIWAEETSGSHYMSTSSAMRGDDGLLLKKEDGTTIKAAFIPLHKLNEVCARLEDELDKAIEESGRYGEYKDRIEILRVAPLWNRLFHTMDGILENGTEEERTKAIADNKKLCSLMRLYCMKYTCFIAMTETTAMYKDFTLSPSKWQYWGSGAGGPLMPDGFAALMKTFES